MRRLKASESPPTPTNEGRSRPVDSSDAAECIRNFATAWAKAKPAVRATMLQSGYERVTVKGEEFVSVRLTPDAYARGFALALPKEVAIPAPSHTGRQPARIKNGAGAPDRIQPRGCHKYPDTDRGREQPHHCRGRLIQSH